MTSEPTYYKWSVIALLDNAQARTVANVNRKAKKWTQYANTDGIDIVEGREVRSYIYKENKPKHPLMVG